ncbi:MAG: succinate dehydrogenase, hydrophobic membrane anchor protein [Pseudomonadota bacterium]
MVTNVTSFSRSGLSDFVVQRVSAVVLALYTVIVLGFFMTAPTLSHEALVAFFGGQLMKVFSTMAVIATVGHAWIGMWTIGTDYIRPHYFGGIATPARLIYQATCMLMLFFYTVWALQIFWRL